MVTSARDQRQDKVLRGSTRPPRAKRPLSGPGATETRAI